MDQNVAPPYIPPLKGKRRSATFLFATALLLVLGLFIGLGLYIEKHHVIGQLRILGDQQHSLTTLISRAVNLRLETLSAQVEQVAAHDLRQPVAEGSDQERLRTLLANVRMVFPEISALGTLGQDDSPVFAVAQTAMPPQEIQTALALWLTSPLPPRATPTHIPRFYVTPKAQLLGIRSRIASDAGAVGTLCAAVDLDMILGSLLHDYDPGPGNITVFDEAGTILHTDNPDLTGTTLFSASPQTDNSAQAMFRAMLQARSGSEVCSIPLGSRPQDVCRLMSWNLLPLDDRTIVIAINATQERVAAHLATESRHRLLGAGLFALVLMAVAVLFARDRTQHRLAYHNLLLQTQQETSPDGILIMDDKPRPRMWNSRLQALWGIDPASFHKHGKDSVMRALRETLKGGDEDFLEIFSELNRTNDRILDGRELHLGDGRILEVHSRGFADTKNDLRGRIWFFRDITRHFNTNKALRRSREQLQSIIDNVPSLVYLRDMQGRFILTNRLYNEIFGWEPGYPEGRRATDILPPDIAQRIRDANNAIATINQPRDYEETVEAQGGTRVLLTREAPIFGPDGKVSAICGISSDITALKELEGILRDTLGEFETIFDNSLVGVLLQRDGRTIAKANARLAAIFGYQPHEMIGRTSEFLHLDRHRYEDFGRKFFATLSTREVFNLEYPMRHRDGHTLHCQLSGKALDPLDLDLGVLWIIDDISERKKLENLRDDVELIMRHDLKTPLSTVIYVPQLMEDDDNLTEEQQILLAELKSAGYRMLEMVNRSLDIFKMEQGTYELNPELFDVLPLLQTIINDLRPQVVAKDLRVGMTLRGDTPHPDAEFPIHGERLLCYSLFANLLKNAMEASPPGGVITLALAGEDERTIAIHNPGTVPEEIRPRFFHKYASTGKAKGLGLGTYSARLIAEAHGGGITMETSERDGTTITVRLPPHLDDDGAARD